jgi:hypothetical protein
MKQFVVYTLVAVLLYSNLTVLAQKTALPPRTTPVSTSSATPTPVALQPTNRARFMSQAWTSGKLPEPMRPIATAMDSEESKFVVPIAQMQKAEAYAKAIAKGDADSMSAVVGALMHAGFAIQGADGSVKKWSGGQGMTIPEYQISAIAKQYGEGQTVGLMSFAKGFERMFKLKKDFAFADQILAGIRDSQRSTVPEIASWSNLIITLGMQHPGQVDISDPNISQERVRFDPIQRELIMMRLVGDIMVAEHGRQARNGGVDRSTFQKASYIREVGLPVAADGAPCVLTGNESVGADYGALGLTQVFSRLAGAIDEIVQGISGSTVVATYLKRSGAANIILNLLKFVATYAALEIDLTMDGGATLTRTKTRAPGERKKLTAHVHIETGKWAQLAACARPLLNFMGLDFSLPGGPGNNELSNVKVTFVLQENEETGGWEAIAHNANLGAYFGDTNTAYSDLVGGVRLEPVTQKAQYTDSNGKASINMVGEPQDRDLSHEKLTGVQRRMGVSAFVAAKTSDPQQMSGSDYAGTIGDYLGPFLSFVTGDELGAAVGAATETLYRAAWYSSDVFPFDVKDWKGCGECWSGTVSMTSTLSTSSTPSTSGTTSSKASTKYTRTISETVTIETDADGVVTSAANIADNASGEGSQSGTDICHIAVNAERNTAPFASSTTRTDSAAGNVRAYPSISVQGTHVSIGIDTDPLARVLAFEEKHSNGCYTDRLNGENSGSFNTMERYPINFSGDGQPTRENTAHGSLTIKDATGGTTTYKWDLERK